MACVLLQTAAGSIGRGMEILQIETVAELFRRNADTSLALQHVSDADTLQKALLFHMEGQEN